MDLPPATAATAATPPVPSPPPMRRNPVVVVGATCRPDAVDGALRRAGRFDREVRCIIL
jgi:ribosome biogenesis ATPase